jgi:UDP-N-acetylglucosamine diphosphorylase/glucosamine-1-phosphate N-acetyltransferase
LFFCNFVEAFFTKKKASIFIFKMMNIILFDTAARENLFPLTLIRPVADLRVGILTIREKWEHLQNTRTSTLTVDYLREKYPVITDDCNLFVDGSMIPTRAIVEKCIALKNGETISVNGKIVACMLSRKEIIQYDSILSHLSISINSPFIRTVKELDEMNVKFVTQLSDIFTYNFEEITADFNSLTAERKSCILSKENRLIGNVNNLFIEEDSMIEAAIINVKEGPVYIGKNVQILEGAIIKGPTAICTGTIVETGAKISGGSTVGTCCKVGGEINNVVFQGFSNKAHDGYLGNAIIGEWCNIGAGSNFSNLQNNYKTIKQWYYPAKKFCDTALQFCGIVMGDYTKCSIGSIFNTGTVTGIGCNLFGEGFHRQFIPSFSYGGKHSGYTTNALEKVLETAEIVCKRRKVLLSDKDKKIITYLFNQAQKDHFF